MCAVCQSNRKSVLNEYTHYSYSILFSFNPNTQPAILTQTISQQTVFARELIVRCMLLATTNAVRI